MILHHDQETLRMIGLIDRIYFIVCGVVVVLLSDSELLPTRNSYRRGFYYEI